MLLALCELLWALVCVRVFVHAAYTYVGIGLRVLVIMRNMYVDFKRQRRSWVQSTRKMHVIARKMLSRRLFATIRDY